MTILTSPFLALSLLSLSPFLIQCPCSCLLTRLCPQHTSPFCILPWFLLFSFQALNHLTLCVLLYVSCIQTHCSGVQWQVRQISGARPHIILLLKGQYSVCPASAPVQQPVDPGLMEHMALSCPGRKDKNSMNFWAHPRYTSSSLSRGWGWGCLWAAP